MKAGKSYLNVVRARLLQKQITHTDPHVVKQRIRDAGREGKPQYGMDQADGSQGSKAAEQLAEEYANREGCECEKQIREVSHAE